MSPTRRLLEALGLVALALAVLILSLGLRGYRMVHDPDPRPLPALRVRADPALRKRGRNPLAPRGPDLLPLVAHAAPDSFRRALQAGVGSGGRSLDPTLMPWRVFRRLSATEVAAVYQFLRRQTGAVRPGS